MVGGGGGSEKRKEMDDERRTEQNRIGCPLLGSFILYFSIFSFLFSGRVAGIIAFSISAAENKLIDVVCFRTALGFLWS